MYVGLDVHKRVCYGTVMDEEGRVVMRGRFNNDPEGLEEFMDGVEEALVAMEAGYCWQPLYDDLEEAGYDVRLAHPQKVKTIAEAKVKTDKIDSRARAKGDVIAVDSTHVKTYSQRSLDNRTGRSDPEHGWAVASATSSSDTGCIPARALT